MPWGHRAPLGRGSVGRRIKIFLRLKADGKIVSLVTSVASFAKVLYVNKS